ncbi:MAG: hypothetical protein GQ538_08205 [Xanthomonadales bacterium]|nr:hypothetical protein [Xanthomonadales bacterium]
MLHWALVQHPNLWGGSESDFMSRLIDGVQKAYSSGIKYGEFHWLSREQVSKAEFFEHIGSGIDRLYSSRSGGQRWVEQTPHYVCNYPGLSDMFPDAKFIHIVRDGRQVVCSMQKMFGWSFIKSMRMWKRHAKAGDDFNRQGYDNFLQIKYESVVTNPQQVFKQIYDFIEEEFDSSSIQFLSEPINAAPSREAESSTDKLLPKWGDWKPHRHKAFQLFCGQLMKDLGYN